MPSTSKGARLNPEYWRLLHQFMEDLRAFEAVYDSHSEVKKITMLRQRVDKFQRDTEPYVYVVN
jgi:hypothetical protein